MHLIKLDGVTLCPVFEVLKEGAVKYKMPAAACYYIHNKAVNIEFTDAANFPFQKSS